MHEQEKATYMNLSKVRFLHACMQGRIQDFVQGGPEFNARAQIQISY